eukprot:scaffold96256_cov72-Phaeocystis_antarctica.AAC.1
MVGQPVAVLAIRRLSVDARTMAGGVGHTSLRQSAAPPARARRLAAEHARPTSCRGSTRAQRRRHVSRLAPRPCHDPGTPSPHTIAALADAIAPLSVRRHSLQNTLHRCSRSHTTS